MRQKFKIVQISCVLQYVNSLSTNISPRYVLFFNNLHRADKLDPNALYKEYKYTLLWLIFACTLTLKRVFSEFLETQLRSSKGVFVLFLLSIWVQFVCFMLSNYRKHDFKSHLLVFCFIQNVTLNCLLFL